MLYERMRRNIDRNNFVYSSSGNIGNTAQSEWIPPFCMLPKDFEESFSGHLFNDELICFDVEDTIKISWQHCSSSCTLGAPFGINHLSLFITTLCHTTHSVRLWRVSRETRIRKERAAHHRCNTHRALVIVDLSVVVKGVLAWYHDYYCSR